MLPYGLGIFFGVKLLPSRINKRLLRDKSVAKFFVTAFLKVKSNPGKSDKVQVFSNIQNLYWKYFVLKLQYLISLKCFVLPSFVFSQIGYSKNLNKILLFWSLTQENFCWCNWKYFIQQAAICQKFL